MLDAPHRLLLRDARIGYAVVVLLEERLLVLGGELAVVRYPLVVAVRDEVEDVFLEVGTGTTDDVDFFLPDHLGERASELRRAHGPRERDHHLAAPVDELLVRARSIDESGRVEMAKVVLHESRDRPFFPIPIVHVHLLALYRDRAAELSR